MARQFQQPNFDPMGQRKQEAQNQQQQLQAIPGLLLQYEALKRQRDLEARNHDIELQKLDLMKKGYTAEHGTGEVAPRNLTSTIDLPGSTLGGGSLGLDSSMTTTIPGETEDEKRLRLGEKGYQLETERMKANKEVRYAVPSYDKNGNVIGWSEAPEGFKPFGGGKPGDSNMTGIRQGNLDIRKDSAIEGMIQKFKSDPRVKKAYQSLDASDDIGNFIDSGNPIAAGAIPTYSARMSGEVGNLSESDKKPFGGSRAILAKIDQSLKEMADGTLSEDNKRFMSEFVSLVKKRAYEKIHSEAVNTSKQKKGLYDLSEKEIYDRIYQGPSVDVPNQAQPAGGQPTGKPTMRWNPATGKVEPL